MSNLALYAILAFLVLNTLLLLFLINAVSALSSRVGSIYFECNFPKQHRSGFDD